MKSREGYKKATKTVAEQYWKALNGEGEYPEDVSFDGQIVWVKEKTSSTPASAPKSSEKEDDK